MSCLINVIFSARTRHLDFINVMTFDFHGPWESVIGHHSPLYRGSIDSGDSIYSNVVSIRLHIYLKHGCFAVLWMDHNLFSPHFFRIQPCSTGWTWELRHTSSTWDLQHMDELLPSLLLQAPALEYRPVVLVKRAVTQDKKDSGLFMRWSSAARNAEFD